MVILSQRLLHTITNLVTPTNSTMKITIFKEYFYISYKQLKRLEINEKRDIGLPKINNDIGVEWVH